MVRNGKKKYYILGLSALLYVLALFNTLYVADAHIGTDMHRLYAHDVTSLNFFIGGFIMTPYDIVFLLNGKVNFTILWFSNITYLYILSLWVKQRRIKTFFILVVLSITFIISFYICHDSIIGRDENVIYYIGDKGIGYYLWLISYLIFFFGALEYKMKKWAKKIEILSF